MHHPHKRPFISGGIFGGVVCELSEPKKKRNMHHPPDPSFAIAVLIGDLEGGGVWISRFDVL